jgi:hypothetical protein
MTKTKYAAGVGEYEDRTVYGREDIGDEVKRSVIPTSISTISNTTKSLVL